MKKYISLVITAIFCLNIALATGITANAMEYGLFEGYGTQKHPFLIKTADDVMALSNAVNGGEDYNNCYFTLTNDINMSGKSFRPIGEGSNSFAGFFDGNLKTVSNITVNGIGKGNYLGFFGNLSGEIRNLRISGITISFANSSSSTRVYGVGGMAGQVSGKVLRSGVRNVSITNTAVDISEYAPGGFIGEAVSGAEVSDCYSINFTWNGSSNAVLGGFIGNVDNESAKVTVKNCYAAGNFIRNRTPYAMFAMGRVVKSANLTRSNNYVSHGVTSNMYSSGITNIDIPALAVSASQMKNSTADLGVEFVADTGNVNNGYPHHSADLTAVSKLDKAMEETNPEAFAYKNGNCEIVSDIDLPSYTLYGAKVVWNSLTPATVSDDGTLSALNEPKPARMSASFTLDGSTVTKTYDFKVGITAASKVIADINGISIPDTVTDDFGLPLSGRTHGTGIVWTSSDSAVKVDGAMARVTRPLSSAGNKDVTLTALGKIEDYTYEKKFTVTVLAYASDGTALSDAKERLTFDVLSEEEASAVTKNLSLPTTFGDGVTVSWSASPGVIASDGVLVKNSADTDVTLTATLTKGTSSDTKTFNVTVKGISNNLAKLQAIADALTFEKLTSEPIDRVTGNLTLPVSTYGGATVSWISSDTSVIKTNGTDLRPSFSSGNKTVRLTAQITLSGAIVEKDFYITVLEKDGDAVYLNESFEGFQTGALPSDNTNFKVYGNTVGVQIKANPTNSAQKSLYIYKTSSMGDTDNGYTFRIPSTVKKGIVNFESDVYIDSMPEKSFRICGFTNIGTEITVNFNRTSTGANVSCGGASKAINSGRWYPFRLEVDTENLCYYAYIGGVKINETPAKFAYSETNSSVRSLGYFLCDFFWMHPTSQTHSVYMDNIKIHQYTAYGELLSSISDKAELVLFKKQNIQNIGSVLSIPSNVEFESGNTEVLSNDGRIIQEGEDATFYLTSRAGNDTYNSYQTREYNISAGFELSGGGTEENPYMIETVTELCKLQEQVNEGNSYNGIYFRLSNDLDMSGISWLPMGDGTNAFEGVFDGDGHTITNISVTDVGNGCSTGFFGNLSGTVRNLGIKDMTVNVNNIGGAARIAYAGGIAGTLKGTGEVDRCYVKNLSIVNTSSENKISYTGGLIGQVTSTQNPSVSNSYVIDFTYTTNVSNEDSYVSGLIGKVASSSSRRIYINNCYVAGLFSSNNLYKYPTAAVSAVDYARSENVFASHGVSVVKSSENLWDLSAKRSNHIGCGYISGIQMRAASLLGDAFAADVDFKNGGYPMLLWEDTDTNTYKFICTGIVEADGHITGVNIEKYDSGLVNTKFIAAVFSDGVLNNVLLTMDISDFTKGANTVEMSGDGTVDSNQTVKIFVWEENTMKPLMFVFEK